MIDPKQLEELKAKASAANDGYWCFSGLISISSRKSKDSMTGMLVATVADPENGEFIAAANPATILSLIAELEQARKDAEALGEALTALEILYGCSEDMQTTPDKILEQGSRDMSEEPIVRQQCAAFMNTRRVLRKFGKIDAALSAQEGEGK